MSINLIPTKIKEEREKAKIMNELLIFLIAYFLLFCVLTSTIYLTNFYLKTNISSLNTNIEQENIKLKEFTDTEKQLISTNQKLTSIQQIDTDRIIWSNVLTELLSLLPNTTQLNSISTDGTNKLITLSGNAKSRTDIANLKDKLEDSGYFKNITFSTSSYNDQTAVYSFKLLAELEKTR